MITAIKLAAAAAGLFVVYRLYQAHRNGVGAVRALTYPLVPVAALRTPGSPLGSVQVMDLAAHPQARTGRSHF